MHAADEFAERDSGFNWINVLVHVDDAMDNAL